MYKLTTLQKDRKDVNFSRECYSYGINMECLSQFVEFFQTSYGLSGFS